MKPEDLIDQFNECMAPTQKVNMKKTTVKLTAKQSMAAFKALTAINVEHEIDGRIVATSIPVVGTNIKGCGSDYKCMRADPETMRKIQVLTSNKCAQHARNTRISSKGASAEKLEPEQQYEPFSRSTPRRAVLRSMGTATTTWSARVMLMTPLTRDTTRDTAACLPFPRLPHGGTSPITSGVPVSRCVRMFGSAYVARARGASANKRTNNTDTHTIAHHYHCRCLRTGVVFCRVGAVCTRPEWTQEFTNQCSAAI